MYQDIKMLNFEYDKFFFKKRLASNFSINIHKNFIIFELELCSV